MSINKYANTKGTRRANLKQEFNILLLSLLLGCALSLLPGVPEHYGAGRLKQIADEAETLDRGILTTWLCQ